MPQVVVDALSGRQVFAGDEEREATQPLVAYLTDRLGWNPRQIVTRPQWRVPKAPSGKRDAGYPVDIAIFDDPEHVGNPAHVRILVECKAPGKKEGVDQLKTYLSLEPEAVLGVWFDGRSHILVYKSPGGFVINDFAPIPRPGEAIVATARRQPLRYGDLHPPVSLGVTFSRLRDQIAAQDTHVNRDEFILNDLANLIICKIADEQDGEMDPGRATAFQVRGGAKTTGAAIRQLFTQTRDQLRSVFTDADDRLLVDDDSIYSIVQALQSYRLMGHDRQAVGQAFQVLRGRALKGEEGAYFTPPPLVDCVVSLLDPTHADKIIDPACGTGGFLAAALNHVFGGIDRNSALSSDRKADVRRRWAQDRLYAVDKDAVSVRLCKAYLTLLGDGRAHAYRANAVDRIDWSDRNDDLKQAVAPGAFDIVLTNPPFGQNLVVSLEVGRREGLQTCTKWVASGATWRPGGKVVEQQLGIAFFERGLTLLKPGGRMAIVLPETFLFSDSFGWFIDWVCRSVTVTHVVDVPMVAFEEFCRAKTCILFVRKAAPPPGHRICMSFPRSIGQDRRGKPLYKMDPVGERTGTLDNEMSEAVQSILKSTGLGSQAADTRYCFRVPQEHARERGVLVPRFWWRQETDAALFAWDREHPSQIWTLGELEERKILGAFPGHGSPPGDSRGTGDVPYVKVTDIKNWRINENPTNFIHQKVAAKLRGRGPILNYGDLVTPARASSNIGQFAMVMPWQTQVVLTREVLVLRVAENDLGIDAFLLLALLSLRVVQRQYGNLALMQTNREHLGNAWREVKLPVPATLGERERIARPVRDYFEALVRARESYEALVGLFSPEDFGTRP